MIYEPAAYSWKHDKARSFRLYRTWAEEAWQQELQNCIGETPSADYGSGFRDGFVDFVYLGGTGEPPPVPPRQYWNAALRQPNGQAAAQQWFDGYRRGAQAARDGGFRQMATVRTSLMGMDAHPAEGSVEMFAPVEPAYRDSSPFEDDLPLPDAPPHPGAAVAPQSDSAAPSAEKKETASESPKSSDPAPQVETESIAPQAEVESKNSVSVPSASENVPEELDLPPNAPPESPSGESQSPGERKVAPPLEELVPKDQPIPDAEPLKSEKQGQKQESSSSPDRGDSSVATTTETPTPRLILVQHVQEEPKVQAPIQSHTHGLRIVIPAGTSPGAPLKESSCGASETTRSPISDEIPCSASLAEPPFRFVPSHEIEQCPGGISQQPAGEMTSEPFVASSDRVPSPPAVGIEMGSSSVSPPAKGSEIRLVEESVVGNHAKITVTNPAVPNGGSNTNRIRLVAPQETNAPPVSAIKRTFHSFAR